MTDMKKIYMLALVLIIGICTGCSKENIEIDFDYDYSEEIKADVDEVVSTSVSLQEELTNIEKITQKYTPLAEAAQTQGEMNVAASSELFSGRNYKKQGLCSCKRVSEDEAVISIYRQGETEGNFVDNGNGELVYTSADDNIKGIIKIDGWNGASFKVTETSGETPFSVGEEFQFPFSF